MIVAEHFGFVVGIDTHAKTHTLAIIDTASGGEIANETFPATTTGGNRALSWILRRTEASPEQVLLSMEGTGSYGAKLRQQASDAGFKVTEAPVPNQRLGRYQGKSDAIDATRAAQATLGIPMDRLREPGLARTTWHFGSSRMRADPWPENVLQPSTPSPRSYASSTLASTPVSP
jgi:transposase